MNDIQHILDDMNKKIVGDIIPMLDELGLKSSEER